MNTTIPTLSFEQYCTIETLNTVSRQENRLSEVKPKHPDKLSAFLYEYLQEIKNKNKC